MHYMIIIIVTDREGWEGDKDGGPEYAACSILCTFYVYFAYTNIIMPAQLFVVVRLSLGGNYDRPASILHSGGVCVCVRACVRACVCCVCVCVRACVRACARLASTVSHRPYAG